MRKMKLLLSVWVCKKRRSRQKNVTVFSRLHFPCFLCRGFVFDLKFHNTHLSIGEEGNCCTESYHTFDPVLEKNELLHLFVTQTGGSMTFFYFPFLYFLTEGCYLHTHTHHSAQLWLTLLDPLQHQPADSHMVAMTSHDGALRLETARCVARRQKTFWLRQYHGDGPTLLNAFVDLRRLRFFRLGSPHG